MRRRLRRACRGVGLASLFLVLLALSVESVIRLILPQVLTFDAPAIYRPDDAIGWRRQPNVRALTNTGERDVEICTDSRGDRISCVERRPAGCTRHILVVGDSFVEALAIPFEQTAWARLQRETGACVYVAGVGAYGPSQYLKVVRERLRDRPPQYDLVLVSLFAGNDFITDAEKIPSPREVWRRPIHLLPEGLGAEALHDWFYPYNQWLESRSHTYVAARAAIRSLADPANVGVWGLPRALVRSRLTPEIQSETLRAFALMAEEARRAGAEFVITVVPVRNQVTDPTGARIRAAFPKLSQEIDMELVQRDFLPRLRGLPGVTTVDILPPLRQASTPPFGTRDGHLSPTGHQVWFQALREPVSDVSRASSARTTSAGAPGTASPHVN